MSECNKMSVCFCSVLLLRLVGTVNFSVPFPGYGHFVEAPGNDAGAVSVWESGYQHFGARWSGRDGHILLYFVAWLHESQSGREREREREKCNIFLNFSAHKDKHRISPAELLLCTWVGNIGTTAWLKKVGGGNWRDPQQRKIFFFWVCVGDECWLIPPIIQPLRSQVHRFFWPPLASRSALSQARKSKCQSSSIVPAFSAVMYYLLTRCVCWISSLISQRIPLQHETFASSSVPI